MGVLNDLYLDTDTDNLFSKSATGWTLVTNLATPGATMNGWIWYSTVYPTATGNTVTNPVFAADHVAATVKVSGGIGDGGGGGVGWHFTNPPSPVNLEGYSFIRFNLNLSVAAGSVSQMGLTLGENGMWGCLYSFPVVSGANTVAIGLNAAPTSCWSKTGFTAPTPASFHPSSIDTVSIELPYDTTGVERIATISVSNVELVW